MVRERRRTREEFEGRKCKTGEKRIGGRGAKIRRKERYKGC